MPNQDVRLQLGKIAQLLDLRIETVVKKVGLDIFTGTVQRMPVDTGRARASVEIQLDSPSQNVPPENKKGAPLSPSDAGKAAAAMDGVDVRKQKIYITSALDYVQYLEGGSSKQAPAGMFGISVQAVATEIDQIIGQAIQEHPDIT
jgi:hypothetical protein